MVVMMATEVAQRPTRRWSLNEDSHEQLYYQLYNLLFQEIVNGSYKVGDLIPSETELVRDLGVSRATIRKAMELLVSNGLIERRRGRGSEVVSDRPSSALRRVTSYLKRTVSDDAAAQKRVISAEIVPADSECAAALGVKEGTPLYRLERVRCAGDTPYYSEVIHLTESHVPHAMERDFSKESLRSYYSNILHVSWSRADQRVCAQAADERIAKLLHIKPGEPVLKITRISFDSDDIPREYMISIYRSDFYFLEMSLES